MLPLLISHSIGARPVTDAYFLAVDTTLFAATIFAVVLKSIVVPFVSEWNANADSSATRNMVAHVSRQATIGATAVYGVTAAVVAFVILPYTSFDVQQRGEVETYLLCLLPLPGAMAWASVLAGAHYAKERWVFPSWSEGFRSAVPILVLVFVGNDLTLVAVALPVGEFVRIAVLQLSWSRLVPAVADSASQPPPLESAAQFWRVAGPQLLSMLVVNANPLIDKLFSSSLPAGAVTTLVLSEKLFFIPQLLLTSAVATVYGTRWARTAVDPGVNRRRLFDDFRTAQRRVGTFGLLLTFALGLTVVGVGTPLATFLRVESSTFVATLLAFIAGLVPALSAALSLRLFLAVKQTRILVLFAAVVVVVNTVGDYFGALWFGVAGIALSSTIVRWVGALMYWRFSARVLGVTDRVPRLLRSTR